MKTHLSADELHALMRCVETRRRYLTDIHWSTVAFGGSTPVFHSTLSEERRLIDTALTKVTALFEEQFPSDPS